jgi:hypothetical protein
MFVPIGWRHINLKLTAAAFELFPSAASSVRLLGRPAEFR